MWIQKFIGNTPLWQIRYNESVSIFAKIENFNPSGSIKDRTAYWMLNNAIKNGKLKKGMKIVEPSSGNTGISLAMLGAMIGIDVLIIMPESVSKERKIIIEKYGGKVMEVSDDEWRYGAIEIAREIEEKNDDFVFLNQYENRSNWVAHYETTGKELTEQIDRVDYFIAGIGTGGTVVGVAKRLKEKFPDVQIIGVQPKIGEKIQGLKNMNESISTIMLENREILDEVVDVPEKTAIKYSHKLGKMGYLVGHSSGAVFFVAKEISKKIKSGNVVVIFPDSGDRYIYY